MVCAQVLNKLLSLENLSSSPVFAHETHLLLRELAKHGFFCQEGLELATYLLDAALAASNQTVLSSWLQPLNASADGLELAALCAVHGQ